MSRSSSLIDRPIASRLSLAARRVLILLGAGVWLAGLAAAILQPERTELFARRPETLAAVARGQGVDLHLHAAVVRRMQGGDGYYEALGDELVRGDFPTTSVFNWRAPFPLWVFGKVPWSWPAQTALACLGFAYVSCVLSLVAKELGAVAALAAGCGVVGAALPAFLPALYVDHLLWATLCIGLSGWAHARQMHSAAVLGGLAALFFRELALGYVVVALLDDLARGRRREVVLWLLGLGVWLLYYAVHAGLVRSQSIGSQAAVAAGEWWSWKSPWFWVRCARFNGLLILLPGWCSYLFLSAAACGLWAMRRGLARREFFSLFGFLAAALIVGKEANDYWGELLTTQLAWGVAGFPSALRGLRRWIGGDEEEGCATET